MPWADGDELTPGAMNFQSVSNLSMENFLRFHEPADTVPSTVSCFGYLYQLNGALYYVGGSGTSTTLGVS